MLTRHIIYLVTDYLDRDLILLPGINGVRDTNASKLKLHIVIQEVNESILVICHK